MKCCTVAAAETWVFYSQTSAELKGYMEGAGAEVAETVAVRMAELANAVFPMSPMERQPTKLAMLGDRGVSLRGAEVSVLTTAPQHVSDAASTGLSKKFLMRHCASQPGWRHCARRYRLVPWPCAGLIQRPLQRNACNAVPEMTRIHGLAASAAVCAEALL